MEQPNGLLEGKAKGTNNTSTEDPTRVWDIDRARGQCMMPLALSFSSKNEEELP